MNRVTKKKKSVMNNSILDKDKKYLLACSFGPDSMAAFHLLLQNGYQFEVAIVNYHLRKESNLEVKGLIDYCNLHNIELHVLDVKKPITRNIENECRKIRYNYFKELCEKRRLLGVIVAHHQDDLIETYLLQKHRQNLPEYYGIKEKSIVFGVEVYRPLLDYKKKDLQDICEQNNVPYMIDLSNLKNAFLRNKIRHEIVEKLDDKNRDKILKEIAKKNKELESIFEVINSNDIHNIKTLIYFDEITYLYSINAMVKSVNPRASVSKKLALELLKIIKSDHPNIRLRIPHNLYFVKEYDRVYFEGEKKEISYSFVIDKPCELDTPYFYLDFRKNTKNRNVNISDYPLTIRNANKGDKTKIKDYEVEVRRLFIDWKMPLSIRKRWPVILNKDNEIIYVPRYRSDFVVDKDSNFFVKI